MNKKFLNEILLHMCVFMIGLCLIVWADKVTNLVSIILGCLAILYGLMVCINYIKNQDRLFRDTIELIYGIVVLVIGFVLVFKVTLLKELISLIVGIYIVITSVLKLSEGLRISRDINKKITGSIILSIIGILVGILCIVGKFLLPDIIVKYIGIMLIIYSIISIANLIIMKRR